MRQRRGSPGRYGPALVASVGAPVVAAVLFVVHLQLWVKAAEERGLETTDWGFAIIIAFVQLVLAMVAALAAWLAWSGRGRRGRRLMGAALVGVIDLAAALISLPTGPHYLVSDLPNIAAVVLTLSAIGWLLAAAAAATTTTPNARRDGEIERST